MIGYDRLFKELLSTFSIEFIALSPEQWSTLCALQLENIEALDSWLSFTRTESD